MENDNIPSYNEKLDIILRFIERNKSVSVDDYRKFIKKEFRDYSKSYPIENDEIESLIGVLRHEKMISWNPGLLLTTDGYIFLARENGYSEKDRVAQKKADRLTRLEDEQSAISRRMISSQETIRTLTYWIAVAAAL